MSTLNATTIIIFGALGTYWALPQRHRDMPSRRAAYTGAIFLVLALLQLLLSMTAPGPPITSLFFYVFSAAAVTGAVLTVTSRNPIYSALWFASVVLSTSGLFLLASAPFLAAGTVIVYAGAIIVTFLFVIMLAQMEGKAIYDRAARGPASATLTCFLLLWCLIYSLTTLVVIKPLPGSPPGFASKNAVIRTRDLPKTYYLQPLSEPLAVLDRAYRRTSWIADDKGVEKQNVAGLGEALYTDHLVTVGLTGVLLFVALVAAVAITNPKRLERPVT